MEELSEEAKEARRKYRREYYQRNKERIRRQTIKYWEKKAAEERAKADETGEDDTCLAVSK